MADSNKSWPVKYSCACHVKAARLFFLFLCILNAGNGQEESERAIRTRRSTTECPFGVVTRRDFYVYLTVNSLIDSNLFAGSKMRRIELNWTLPPRAKSSDWVGLFRRDPKYRITKPLVRVNAARGQGYFKTSFQFPQNPMLGLNSPLETCLFGYWIGYISDNRTLKSNCLRLRPHWMWNERETIGNIPLHGLMIPGSHNAGSYKIIDSSSSYNILNRYSVNQGEDVWTQLLYGIRYLDIRVGYYKHTPEKFWIVHHVVKMNPLYIVLQDVRKFLQATREIVIMDFHRFPQGFEDPKVHLDLIRYLDEELGEFMAPDWLGREVTPYDMWRMNRTLILTYSHDPSSAYNDKVWSEVRHAWGNKQDLGQLYRFLEDSMERHYSAKYPWAAMTHLTPTTLEVILNPHGGFAKLSDKIARQITRWYRDEWWDSANLVATDYILGNNLVEESIRANRKRKKCRMQYRWIVQ